MLDLPQFAAVPSRPRQGMRHTSSFRQHEPPQRIIGSAKDRSIGILSTVFLLTCLNTSMPRRLVPSWAGPLFWSSF
jgi:hypothetical protein